LYKNIDTDLDYLDGEDNNHLNKTKIIEASMYSNNAIRGNEDENDENENQEENIDDNNQITSYKDTLGPIT